MDTVLVTGAGGFLGRFLCPLLAKEHGVVGADLPNVESVSGVEWKTVGWEKGLASLAREVCPDVVIHAAFINRKPPDLTDRQYLDKILAVNIPLFETLAGINGKLLLISSSAVYGKAEGMELVDEMCPLRPISPYGLAKVFQEATAQYYSTLGLKVCIARPFNLIGAGQKLGMILPDWVKQVRAIVEGKSPELKIRHRKTSRDFVDVRDAARAIALMVRDFQSGEVFNIASGEAVSLVMISEELETLCSTPLKIVETEPNLSESDALAQRGSFEKIESVYGWHPMIDWRWSLKDLWDSWGR
jgi:GDP-4-dehydro-6-deoxy-D-mannose reductase